MPPVYHFWGCWLFLAGEKRPQPSRSAMVWSRPRCAGRMELDQVPAEIPIQAKHHQGNNLSVRREPGWCGAVLCRGCGEGEASPALLLPILGPGGMRWKPWRRTML